MSFKDYIPSHRDSMKRIFAERSCDFFRIIGIGGVIMASLLYNFLPSPSATSASAQGIEKRMLGTLIGLYQFMDCCDLKLMTPSDSVSRRAVERHEGDRERDETEAEKAEEASLIKKAREKALKSKESAVGK